MNIKIDLKQSVKELLNDPELRKIAKQEKSGWRQAFLQAGSEMSGTLSDASNELIGSMDPYGSQKRRRR